jgi:hypothetical protein
MTRAPRAGAVGLKTDDDVVVPGRLDRRVMKEKKNASSFEKN